MKLIRFVWRTMLLAAASLSAGAVDPASSVLSAVTWSKGPATVDLQNVAGFALPAGYLFLDGSDTKKLLAGFANKTSGREIGFITPQSRAWFVIVEFLDVGYVRDDGWRTLDASVMLARLQRTDQDANSERQEKGWPTVTVQDWALRPRYDADAHQMEWAVRAESGGAKVVNHTISVLGRGGVIQFCLVDPDQRDATLSAFRELVRGISFKAGQRYDDHQTGDRGSNGGLTVLVGNADESATESTPRTSDEAPDRTAWKSYVIWLVAVFGAAAMGFVSGRFSGHRQRHRPSRFKAPKRPRPVSQANRMLLPANSPTAPEASLVSDPTVPAAAVLPPDSGGQRRRRYDSYSFYLAMTRNLHWTINY